MPASGGYSAHAILADLLGDFPRAISPVDPAEVFLFRYSLQKKIVLVPLHLITSFLEFTFGSLDYPKSLSKIAESEEGYTENKYNGYVGSDSNSKSTVRIQTANGNVELKTQ